ncbi:MAG: hypothetical protein JGK21_30950 [Microcoleus sp. PH2017_22_RUC_O_B]|nr:hypothetical protein [Microcoleus sp. PH2017_21_RUC_O_A]MCC3544663.1 hypothetical protein [Microcoleus sp. PH2017_22_RUC_O_B]
MTTDNISPQPSDRAKNPVSWALMHIALFISIRAIPYGIAALHALSIAWRSIQGDRTWD